MTEEKDETKPTPEAAPDAPDAPEVETEGDADGDGDGKDLTQRRAGKILRKVSAILEGDEFAVVCDPTKGFSFLAAGSTLSFTPAMLLGFFKVLGSFIAGVAGDMKENLVATQERMKDPKNKLKLIVPGRD